MPEPSDSGTAPAHADAGNSTPVWRAVFDAFERPLAAVSEACVQSDLFMDGFAVTWRLRRRLNAELRRALDAWFASWQLPTRSDVDRLSNEVAGLERQVRDLRGQLERDRSPDIKPGGAPRRPAAGKRR